MAVHAVLLGDLFVDDATHAVMPPDPEMLTAALLLLTAGRGRRQAAES